MKKEEVAAIRAEQMKSRWQRFVVELRRVRVQGATMKVGKSYQPGEGQQEERLSKNRKQEEGESRQGLQNHR